MSFPHIEKTITFDDETGILTEEVTGGYRVNIGRQVEDWISVDDRLPENTSACLVYVDTKNKIWGGKCDIALFNSHKAPYKLHPKTINRFLIRDMKSADGYRATNRVTHWMPLPEPPSMNEGE